MRRFLFFLLTTTIVLTCCTHIKQITHSIKQSIGEASENNSVEVEEVKKRVSSLIHKEDYEGALDLIVAEIRKGRSEQEFSSQYLESCNGFLNQGLVFYDTKQYHRAGMIFRKILSKMPSDPKLRSRMTLSSQDISVYIAESSDQLMEEGLMEYRAGNLEKAVAIWKGIIQFNPEHERAKKALETATVQQNNLEKIEKE